MAFEKKIIDIDVVSVSECFIAMLERHYAQEVRDLRFAFTMCLLSAAIVVVAILGAASTPVLSAAFAASWGYCLGVYFSVLVRSNIECNRLKSSIDQHKAFLAACEVDCRLDSKR